MSTTTARTSRIARRARTVTVAFVGALALVASLDWATYAATGYSLVLGTSNSAASSTVISRTTSGPVMTLKTRGSSDAPFATNGTGKVKNFNSDRLDGLDSKAFARTGALNTVRKTANNALSRSAIATAFVDNYYTDPYFVAQSGFESVTFDATYNRYRLKMAGKSYYWKNHVAAVTASCPTNKAAMVSVSNADGMIDVWLRDSAGAFVKCSFSVVVYNM